MNPDFSNKVVLVTGASAGIGEATALLFARLGARLALVGRSAGSLRAAAERCYREKGQEALEIVADLSTDEGVEKTAKDTIEHFGRVVIGKATALLFARLGARVALVGRSAGSLPATAERCHREKGQEALEIVADLSTDEGVEKTAKDTIEHFGRLDVLVNNAAEGGPGTIRDADMDTFDRAFRTNVRAVYQLTALLVPELVKTRGNIVNVSSIAGTAVHVGSLPYSMTKAALDHFSRLIALELAPQGVRVNTVSPGITDTKFIQRITGISDESYRQWLRDVSPGIPLGRACSALDVARAIVHLASEHSALVTGALLAVDGAFQFAFRFAVPDDREQKETISEVKES